MPSALPVLIHYCVIFYSGGSRISPYGGVDIVNGEGRGFKFIESVHGWTISNSCFGHIAIFIELKIDCERIKRNNIEKI